jgi:hypothetical protein
MIMKMTTASYFKWVTLTREGRVQGDKMKEMRKDY